MRQLLLLVCINVALFANNVWDKKVHSFGNLTEVFKNYGLTDTISLQNLKNSSSLYAVGLLDKLQGEINILDSKPYISSINSNGKLIIDKTLQHQASFLLYAKVPQWISIKVPSTIYNKQQFVEYLEDVAKENGISTFSPFPFLLEGKIKANTYRVISYKQNDILSGYSGTCACDLSEDQKRSQNKHVSFTLQKTLLNTPMTLLGFYSPKRGIITDEYSYTYINFLTQNGLIAGHSQKLMIGESMILKLPKVD